MNGSIGVESGASFPTSYIREEISDNMTQRISQSRYEVIIFGKVDETYNEKYYTIGGVKNRIRELEKLDF